ncbi:MAG: Obg family GTPase CgtA [Collinsella sp.]
MSGRSSRREWERRRLQREKRFRIVQEEPGAFRVVGRAIERMVIQTDWENEEAVIYLQHKFARMGVDDALEKAGCRAGDEVRICQRAFDFEGAEDFSEYEELEDAGEDVAVEAIDVADAADEGVEVVDAADAGTMPRPRRASSHVAARWNRSARASSRGRAGV